MKPFKVLNIRGTILDKNQLEKYLEKLASEHVIKNKSDKETNPIYRLKENFKFITYVYNILNNHLKIGITIHPAGEWLLDNYYIIEETVRNIENDLKEEKYINFVGIENGSHKGFARIYELASEIAAYTEYNINSNIIEYSLLSYQKKKLLSMEEIWNVGIFLQIACIENIRNICEHIYNVQMQKYKVENIIERLVDSKPKDEQKYRLISNNNNNQYMKYPFIEYMSYRLKKYGKKTEKHLKILEEQVEKTGSTVSDVIKKHHFEIANQKVLMGNSIKSIKEISRTNFIEIFEKINGVEEILRNDPANVYKYMDYKTKELYRNKLKELSKKSKTSESYIANKLIELAENNKSNNEKGKHIGYYLISEGKEELEKTLGIKSINIKNKEKKYIFLISILSIFVSFFISNRIENRFLYFLTSIFLIIPISQIIIAIIQYISGKTVKPKLIPKLDMVEGLPESLATFVVIPTIVKNKEKVNELMKKLEVFYLANKSKNIYFALLGDSASSDKQVESYDEEVIKEGRLLVEKLNNKYKTEGFPIFHFIYRKRFWNEKEGYFLGWERKRGLLFEFNEYLLNNKKPDFNINTLAEEKKIPKIKYIITLDSDTNLILNSGLELVGAMAHILNKPLLKNNIVVEGHALIQPRVGIDIESSRKSLFTKIFAGSGGIDAYTNAISDFYQDNFGEGIFTGKGIYDLELFSKTMADEISENKVLSHDLLEGCYLRCGLASDILVLDGYPTKYISNISRQSRWIRGDWQISTWLCSNLRNKKGEVKKNYLNLLSKFKIFDNLRRSLVEVISVFVILFCFTLKAFLNIKVGLYICVALISILIPTILDIIDEIVFKKETEKQKNFMPNITGIKGSILRGIIAIGTLPHKAYISICAIIKTIYRMCVTKKGFLEWITAEEAEKQAKNDLKSYYAQMFINIILGLICLIYGLYINMWFLALAVLWLISPVIVWYISKEIKEEKVVLEKNDKDYILGIALNTWNFFKDYLKEENNYLIPDNYQKDRKPIVVPRTSSTNIGLSLLSVISAYDLKFIDENEVVEYLSKIISTIEKLSKWNGHLYNWYNIKTLEPLIPRYISTVDSGNFVGYLYVVKQFLVNKKELNEDKVNQMIFTVDKLIEDTDFSTLYEEDKKLFSIGFNVEENKLTDSYYDLLASEARQASLIAIAKKDVPLKHWYSLSRVLTILNKHKGLISWSGTAFEYLMPNINIKKYKGSLLDESCKFMVMSQREYAKKIGIPWGISESAFNLKDLNSNYQYKAFGIPWLGLKRGLEDEVVVSSYGSVLAIPDYPKEVIKNIKRLEENGMRGEYGLYESIDYTVSRLPKNKTCVPVKTYMAHHQALILLSINNLINNNIFVDRFMSNPELQAVDILLQEKMPEKVIITKEKKEKPEKLKYEGYDVYNTRVFNKVNKDIVNANVISNDNYTILMTDKGEGFSKYNDILINRYKPTSEVEQGIFTYVKNVNDKRLWAISNMNYLGKADRYEISFMPDKNKITRQDGWIKTEENIGIAPNDSVEIRNMNFKNTGGAEAVLEITTFFEPVLSKKENDYAHPAFNNLFLSFEYIEDEEILLVKRKKREKSDEEILVGVTLYTEDEIIGNLEYEVDKEKFIGRENFKVPLAIENSKTFSNKANLVVSPIVAMKKTARVNPEEEINLSFIIAIGKTKEEVVDMVKKYKNTEEIKKVFKLSKARIEEEIMYLGLNSKEVELAQKVMTYLILDNPQKKVTKNSINKNYKRENLWKYGISGDLPILLFKIKDESSIDSLEKALKIYDYIRNKNIEIDVVILNEEKYSYEQYLREEIENVIRNRHMEYLINQKGGIFIINTTDNEEKEFLEFIANMIIENDLEQTIRSFEDIYLEEIENIEKRKYIIENIEYKNEEEKKEELLYDNEYGGFSNDGKKYQIVLDKKNKLPTVWSHILANPNFGTLVTENTGGFTWSENSRLNKLTAWNNEPVLNIPSEIIYLTEENTGKSWSIGISPKPDDNKYNIEYGFGYAKYKHNSFGIKQEMNIHVPTNEKVKINTIKLQNTLPKKRDIKLVYYIKPVMGEDETKTNLHIETNFDKQSNVVYAKNVYSDDFENKVVYVTSSEKIKSYTGDKKEFIGNGTIMSPEAIDKVRLDNKGAMYKEACICIEIEISLESYGEKEIAIILGEENNNIDVKNTAYKYSKLSNCRVSLENSKKYWEECLGKIQVKTPVKSIDILLNGWLLYQTLVCRMWAKSAFYQSGGAIGFRDQLQDTLALKYIDTNIMKNQILMAASHQFIEGDVEHWWHEETSRGVRTRFSDDRLWLVYLSLEYIKFTNDYSILDLEVNYRSGKELLDTEDENYDLHVVSEIKENIYCHLKRAIEISLNFGENGLPKIGSGDWNDGMSTVGNKGKGESVWLGFFLYKILEDFIHICEKKGDIDLANKYKNVKENLKKALNTNGWDGYWYKRAFMDDGQVLGSMENEECKIDGISQSWSVISGAGDNDKKYISMESLDNHLVDRENGIIKLLDPPFEKSMLEPGYIKAYMPGVRENGGQYTHGAIWAIIANCKLGFGRRATEYFRIINPIEHSKTKELANKYKVEPYVVAADIYSADNLAGRGGWTWYTGSSSWLYIAGIENILGMKIENGYLKMNPCIPNEWKEYEIRYKYKTSVYDIKVKNPNNKETGVEKFTINGEEIEDKQVLLKDDGKIYVIEITM